MQVRDSIQKYFFFWCMQIPSLHKEASIIREEAVSSIYLK